MNNEELLIVGAKKKFRGEIDYSQAAVMETVPKISGAEKIDLAGLIIVAEDLKMRNAETAQNNPSKIVRDRSQKIALTYDEVVKNLHSLQNNGISTKEDALKLLHEWLNDTEKAQDGTSDDNEFELLSSDMESIRATIKLIEDAQASYIGLIKKRQAKQAQIKNQVVTPNSCIKVQLELQKAREQIKLAEILEQGGVSAHLSLPAEYSQNGYSGFSNLADQRLIVVDKYSLFKNSDPVNYEEKSGQLEQEGIHELVLIAPLQKISQINASQPVRSWWGGKKTEYVPEVQVTIPKHEEMVRGGKKEEAYSFIYRTIDSQTSEYMDYSGRGGQTLVMEIILPKSEALELQEMIKVKPELARGLVELAMLNRLNLNQEAWAKGDKLTNNTPLKPPYKRWVEQGDGKSKLLLKGADSAQVLEFMA